MGVWGTGILDDDAAVDVYGLYIDQYNLGMSVEEIRAYLNPRCGAFTRGTSALQPDEVPEWLALALAQWECQAVDADVLEAVEAIVTRGLDAGRWQEEDATKRASVIKRFLKKVGKRRKKPRKRVKPRLFRPLFTAGDCLAVRLEDGFFAAGVCLASPAEPTAYPSATILPTGLHQAEMPSVEQVLAAETAPHQTRQRSFTAATYLAAQRQTSVLGQASIGRVIAPMVWGSTRFAPDLGYAALGRALERQASTTVVSDFLATPEPSANAALGARIGGMWTTNDGDRYKLLASGFDDACRAVGIYGDDDALEAFIVAYFGVDRVRAVSLRSQTPAKGWDAAAGGARAGCGHSALAGLWEGRWRPASPGLRPW